MKFFLIMILFFLSNCSDSKKVYICGDHVCKNKKEVDKYFSENFYIETVTLSKQKKENLDLVELNMKSKQDDNREFTNILKKKEKNYEKKEKEPLIANVNKKSINQKKISGAKNTESQMSQKNEINSDIEIIDAVEKDSKIKKKAKKKSKKVLSPKLDICIELKECNIEEISMHLMNIGKNKKYPDITSK